MELIYEIILSSQYLEIKFDGDFSREMFKKGFEEILEYLENSKQNNILIDIHEMKNVNTQTVLGKIKNRTNIADDLIKTLQKMKDKRLSIYMNKSDYNSMIYNHLRIEGINLKIFFDSKNAINWLEK
jgi:hypothetical protein